MNQTTITVPVPDDRAGGIIGKGGSTIKDLERRFSVKITIPQTAEPGFPPMRMVLVAGSPQDAENARGAIQGILDGYGGGQRGGGYGGGGMGGGMPNP
jgi:far upstream element-binding protein